MDSEVMLVKEPSEFVAFGWTGTVRNDVLALLTFSSSVLLIAGFYLKA